MNKKTTKTFAGALLAGILPMVVSAQTTFFSDNFTGASTVNSATPANPTATSTAYEEISTKAWTPTAPVIGGHLKFGFVSTTSGNGQIQALFANSPVALFQNGDYVQLTIVFTNTAGCLTGAGQLGVGLYSSGQVKPYPGGYSTAGAGGSLSGYAQNWQGYVGQINYTGSASRIMTRPSNASTATANNQDLISSGSSSSSYVGSATIGSTVTSTVTLTAGATYTEVLYAMLNGVNSVAVTNFLYSGAGTGGTLLTSFGAVATNTTFTTSAFDGLAFGYMDRSTDTSNTLDVASIQVAGSVSAPTPPNIITQPSGVVVANGGAAAFTVSATGVGLTYQWHRHGTNLIDGANISGSTSSQLIVSSASSADVAAADATGYYVTISGAGNLSTNSLTNSLSLIAPVSLYYSGSGPWDVNNSASWNTDDAQDQSAYFNYGDALVFDDGGAGGTVTLTGNFLSASSVTVSHTTASAPYTWSGTGSFAGPGSLIYNGSGQFNVNNANTFTGGTIISNAAANLHLGNANGLGTGPVTLTGGGGTMEWTVGGGSASGLGNVIVADNFTIQLDTASTYSGVILGSLSGTIGKTLTLASGPTNTSVNERVRLYGTNTVCNANITFNSGGNNLMSLAPYASSGSQVFNGVIAGDGSIWQRGSASTILNAQNTYSGGTYITSGGIGFGVNSTPTTGTVTSGPIGTGPLYIAPENGSANGSGTVLASGGAITIANALQYPTNNQILIIGGTNVLTFSGPYTLNGNDGLVTNRTFQVNNTNAPVTISGVISDNGTGCGFIKTGVGNLYLDGVNTYTGITTNNSATPVTGLGVLAGTGTIAGNVFIQTNSAIGGGDASGMGTFNIGGNLTINGNGWFRVNRSGSASDYVAVTGNITNLGTGTIAITNQGTTLQIGDTFTLFNKAVTGAGTLAVTGGNVTWTNKLAINGTIAVVQSPDVGVLASIAVAGQLGVNLTNTITVTNLGPGTASGLVVTDSLPAIVGFVSATGGGSTNGNVHQVVWSGFSLPANTVTNFTLIVTAPTAGNATNIVTVASSVVDPSLANNTATNVTVITATIVPTVPPHVSSFSLTGGNLVISATNGVNGGTYYLLGATNAALPLNQWKALATNVITAGSGTATFTFTGTNVISAGLTQQFYILSSTNN